MYMGIDGTVHLDETTRKKAIRLNPKYAYSVPWHRSFGKIATLLGFYTMSPDAGAFADGVARWQASKAGLKIDGILGPNTWKIMRPETNFTDAAAALTDPAWLKETVHKARAEPAQGNRPNTGSWVGLSVEVAWMAGAGGRGTVLQRFYSVDDPGRSFLASADRVKIGVGVGYGISASVVLAANLYTPSTLIGQQHGGWDFNFAIGTRVATLVKNAINLKRFQRLKDAIEALKDAEKAQKAAKTTKAVKEATKLGPEEIATISKAMKEHWGALDAANETKEVKIASMGIPIPGLVEISAGYVDDKYEFIH